MSALLGRVTRLARKSVRTVREDAADAKSTDHSLLHAIRFIVETVAAVGLSVRQLCYFAAAVVMETIRVGEEPVFDDDYDVTVRWSWLGPAWEYDAQSRWEIRLAAVFCVVTGFVLYETLAYFPLSLVERALLWVTCGALVIEPAWTHAYLQSQSEAGE